MSAQSRPAAASLPSVGRIVIAGIAALAVAMGIGRFAFTPLMPLMLRDGSLDAVAGAEWAAANYIGYLVGALDRSSLRAQSPARVTPVPMGGGRRHLPSRYLGRTPASACGRVASLRCRRAQRVDARVRKQLVPDRVGSPRSGTSGGLGVHRRRHWNLPGRAVRLGGWSATRAHALAGVGRARCRRRNAGASDAIRLE